MIFIYLFIPYVFGVYLLGLHSCSSIPAKLLLATHQLYSQATVINQVVLCICHDSTIATLALLVSFSPQPKLLSLHKRKDEPIYISPHWAMTTSVVGLSRIVLQFSIFRTTFMLSPPTSSVTTFPNTTCFPSRNGVGQEVMKN